MLSSYVDENLAHPNELGNVVSAAQCPAIGVLWVQHECYVLSTQAAVAMPSHISNVLDLHVTAPH